MSSAGFGFLDDDSVPVNAEEEDEVAVVGAEDDLGASDPATGAARPFVVLPSLRRLLTFSSSIGDGTDDDTTDDPNPDPDMVGLPVTWPGDRITRGAGTGELVFPLALLLLPVLELRFTDARPTGTPLPLDSSPPP